MLLMLSLAIFLTGCAPALVGSAIRGDANSVKTLLDKGADVNARDMDGNTALDWAAGQGYVEIVKLLLDRGADVNVKDKMLGFTPLMTATRSGHTEIAKLLLDRGADVNVVSGAVAFSWTSFDGSRSESGVRGGWTALMIAAQYGYVDIVKSLLERKADINLKDANGDTALKLAEKNNYNEIIKLLKEAGAKE
jgi:ankyrin repeat protein